MYVCFLKKEEGKKKKSSVQKGEFGLASPIFSLFKITQSNTQMRKNHVDTWICLKKKKKKSKKQLPKGLAVKKCKKNENVKKI